MKTVYFIRPIGMDGPVKIGCAISPDQRRRTLETWSPFPLEIIAEIAGDYALERRFHARFLDQHIRHEWFQWSPDLQAVVDAVAQGIFDIGTLPDAVRLIKYRVTARDLSFITDSWRYTRSVQSRVSFLRDRGLSAEELNRAQIWNTRSLIEAEGLDAVRARVEPIIAGWTDRFPPASRRTKTNTARQVRP